MVHDAPTQTAVENRPQVESGESIALQFGTARQTDDGGQFAIRAERGQVALGGGFTVGAGAHQRRSCFESPDHPAAVGGEIGAG
jgi:hypothetical protein